MTEDTRRKVRQRVADNYRYAFKDNRRQVLKAFEPFVNRPGFVK
jgi:hypothetical protein